MTVTQDTTAAFVAGTAVDTKAAGETIDAATFRQMVDTLDAMIQHTHTFTDNYTSNCQCNCSRGSL